MNVIKATGPNIFGDQPLFQLAAEADVEVRPRTKGWGEEQQENVHVGPHHLQQTVNTHIISSDKSAMKACEVLSGFTPHPSLSKYLKIVLINM